MIDVKELLNKPMTGIHSIANYPICENLNELDADIAIIGIPENINTLYRSGTRFAPKALRDSSALLNSELNGSFNAEWDGMYLNPSWKIVDCGDIEVVHGDIEQTFKIIESTIEKIVSRGAIPVVLGADHSITVPVAKALKSKGSFYTVQIDAFLDYANHKSDQNYGQGNPMRCLSEMDHVEGIAQLGVRAGSSRKEDFDAAEESGNMILSPRKMRELGVQEILNRIPDSERYYVTIDTDGLDFSINPGTSPNDGVYDYEVCELLKGLVRKGEVIGFDIVEMNPSYDYTGNVSQTVARIKNELIELILTEKEKSL